MMRRWWHPFQLMMLPSTSNPHQRVYISCVFACSKQPTSTFNCESLSQRIIYIFLFNIDLTNLIRPPFFLERKYITEPGTNRYPSTVFHFFAQEYKFDVTMTCSGCSGAVTRALTRAEGTFLVFSLFFCVFFAQLEVLLRNGWNTKMLFIVIRVLALP